MSCIRAGASMQLAADSSGPGLEWMQKRASLVERYRGRDGRVYWGVCIDVNT